MTSSKSFLRSHGENMSRRQDAINRTKPATAAGYEGSSLRMLIEDACRPIELTENAAKKKARRAARKASASGKPSKLKRRRRRRGRS